MLRHLLFRRARICSSRLGSKCRLVEKHHEWPRPVVCGPDKRHISCLCFSFRDIHAHRCTCFDMGNVCVIDVFIPCSKESYCMLLCYYMVGQDHGLRAISTACAHEHGSATGVAYSVSMLLEGRYIRRVAAASSLVMEQSQSRSADTWRMLRFIRWRTQPDRSGCNH